ncbi:MAG: hypothetical protein E7342_00980 [Clostridiales bacterium]|nr:hypothetical protein [Clostridiales bacterium]
MNFLNSLKKDRLVRIKFFTSLSFAFNFIYALFNFIVGIYLRSYWFITIGAYFFVLGFMRSFSIISIIRKKDKNLNKIIGFLLIFLIIILVAMMALSDMFDVIKPLNEIIMISIATFTTAKTVIAILNTVKAKRLTVSYLAIRNLSLVSASFSILSMQRSMLVSFGNMSINNIRIFNFSTGFAFFLFLLVLIVIMIKRKS